MAGSKTGSLRAQNLAILVVTAAVLAGVGCNVKEDFDKICHAEKLSNVAKANVPPDENMKFIAAWVDQNVHTTDARHIMSRMALAGPSGRGRILKEGAKEAGYTGKCPLADMQ